MRFIQWFLFSLVLASPLSRAESALDLAALQQFFKTGEQLEQASSKYPALSEESEEFLLTGDNQALIKRLKSAGALDEVNAIVRKSGYESMDQYVDITKRVMAAFFAVQLQQSPYSSAEDMRKMVDAQKQALVENGVSPEMIEQMMAGVREQLNQLDELFVFAQSARPEDVAAVSKNLDYVNTMIGE